MYIFATDKVLYLDNDGTPKQLTNFVPQLCVPFYTAGVDSPLPEVLEVNITLEDGTERLLTLPMSENLPRDITKQDARAIEYKRAYSPYVQQYLIDQLSQSVQRGIYFPGNGTYHLPDSQCITVWNGRIAGNSEIDFPYLIAPNKQYRIATGTENPLSVLVNALLENNAALVLPVIYALVVSRRDVLTVEQCPLQGGLYITGVQSSGKTTLARRVFGYAQRTGASGKPAFFLEAVSTEASVRDALSEAPGCVVVVDDLALSSTRSIEMQRRKLGSAVFRLSTNDANSAKKNHDGTTDHRDCTAGIALTAEFVLDGISELTRSIFVYLDRPLNLTEEVQPALIGDTLECFADWFADNYEHAITLLHQIADKPDILSHLRVEGSDEFEELLSRERRIQANLALMQWAFVCMIEMIKAKMELPSSVEHALYEQFWTAVHQSVAKQVSVFAEIKTRKKEGNISYLLCEAIDADVFRLCRNKDKLFKRNGIVWKEDRHGNPVRIGLKVTPLVQYLRNQNGYQDYSSRKIITYLKDIGALTLNEDKSNTVHIGKTEDGKRVLPRVLMIDVSVLRENAQRFDLFSEQAK